MTNRFIDTLKNLRRKKGIVMVCPKCQSKEVYRTSSFDGWLTPARYFCRKCGYVGSLIFEAEK